VYDEEAGIFFAFYFLEPDPLSIINNYVSEGGKISQANSAVDGKTCLLYTGTRTCNPAMVFWDVRLP